MNAPGSLLAAHETLARELERKDVLIHCIVHDLASPLNSMLGALSLLEEGALEGRTAEMVHIATRAAMRQRELIREILDVFASERSALDAPYDELNLTPDVWTSIEAVTEAVMPVALSRSVK